MKDNILSEMLLIQDGSVFNLYEEMKTIAGYFIAPAFSFALILEYFGDMDFGGVIKKLLLISFFMGFFYEFHTKAIDLSLETASITLKKVSPRNLFVKKWYSVKVRTTEQKQWGFLESFAVPNLNDLVATAFFLASKAFIWLLKLIYSSVYHLTYVFSGITAVLYLFGWTKDALKGTVQASIWCMLLPFVVVAILALVGNSIDAQALSGDLVIAKVDSIVWLFGITLLLLLSPVITIGMVKGDGIHSVGAKMGSMIVSSGVKAAALAPIVARLPGRVSQATTRANNARETLQSKILGGSKSSVSKIGETEKVKSEVTNLRSEGKATHSKVSTQTKVSENSKSQFQNAKNSNSSFTKEKISLEKGGFMKVQETHSRPMNYKERSSEKLSTQKEFRSSNQAQTKSHIKTEKVNQMRPHERRGKHELR